MKNNTQLFYRTYGKGDPILIAHGLYSMSDAWIPTAKILANAGYTTIIPDLRNHGQSPHYQTHKYTDIAKDLFNLIQELGLEKTHIIGHSMGGKVMMQYCKQYPETVNKSIFVDIAPRSYTKLGSGLDHRAILTFMSNFDWSDIKNREDFLQKLPDIYQDDAQFFLKNIRRNKQKQFEWKINAPVLLKELENIGQAVDFKPVNDTLFVKGDLSSYISEEDVEILKKMPNTQIARIKNGGHRLHSQNTEELSKIILKFLSE